MSVIQGPSTPNLQTTAPTESTTEAKEAQIENSSTPSSAILTASSTLSSTAVLNLTARNFRTIAEGAADNMLATLNQAMPRTVAQQASARLLETADSDLFARLDSAKQNNITKADGKITRGDLRAAINNGGLSPEERTIAEYLLANFDTVTTGRHIRSDDLRAHAAGIALSTAGNVPMAGLKTFMDDQEASSFFGFNRHDKDFRDLANGVSIDRAELERGLRDDDFSNAQKGAIQFLLDNLDTIGGSDGRIQESELASIVNTIERSQLSHNIGAHREQIKDFVLDDSLYQALSGTTSTRGTVTKAELELALNSSAFSSAQKSAISFLHDNFDVITNGGDQIYRSDLENLVMHDIANLSHSIAMADQAYRNAAQARSPAFNDMAQLESFVAKVDGLFRGDDQGHSLGFISWDRGQPGEEQFDNRTTFSNPISLFSNQDAPSDGHVSRNDLEHAINSDELTTDEKNLALVLLNNFSEIGNNKSTVNANQIAAFLNTFTLPANAQSQSASLQVQPVNPMQITKI